MKPLVPRDIQGCFRFGVMFCLSAIFCQAESRYSFEAKETAEVVAELHLRSPDADWAVKGREAAVARVELDGGSAHHVVLYGGPSSTTYRVFLGPVKPGHHELTIEKDEQQSAPGAGLDVSTVRFEQFSAANPEYEVIAHAPVLYARFNTVGRFSDVPLIVYAEETAGQLQYTVIFSNEDGGTSTRALMARWGRTTDIEYVYVFSPGKGGAPDQAVVQGPNHEDMKFTGRQFASHPLLMPVTDNNMVAEATESPLRFQIAPIRVDLRKASRESVMDRFPVTYAVMAKELERERKLRPFGVTDGEKISDQRNYLFVDYSARFRQGRFSVSVLLRDGRAFSSDLGRFDYAIGRDGAVRTTVELPPGTTASEIAGLSFACLAAESDRQLSHDGVCTLESLNRAFFLDRNGLPGRDVMASQQTLTLLSGQAILLKR